MIIFEEALVAQPAPPYLGTPRIKKRKKLKAKQDVGAKKARTTPSVTIEVVRDQYAALANAVDLPAPGIARPDVGRVPAVPVRDRDVEVHAHATDEPLPGLAKVLFRAGDVFPAAVSIDTFNALGNLPAGDRYGMAAVLHRARVCCQSYWILSSICSGHMPHGGKGNRRRGGEGVKYGLGRKCHGDTHITDVDAGRVDAVHPVALPGTDRPRLAGLFPSQLIPKIVDLVLVPGLQQ